MLYLLLCTGWAATAIDQVHNTLGPTIDGRVIAQYIAQNPAPIRAIVEGLGINVGNARKIQHTLSDAALLATNSAHVQSLFESAVGVFPSIDTAQRLLAEWSALPSQQMRDEDWHTTTPIDAQHLPTFAGDLESSEHTIGFMFPDEGGLGYFDTDTGLTLCTKYDAYYEDDGEDAYVVNDYTPQKSRFVYRNAQWYWMCKAANSVILSIARVGFTDNPAARLVYEDEHQWKAFPTTE